jgi:uncharacterized protein (DUF885 family)
MPEPAALRRLAESWTDLRWHLDPVEGSGAGVAACDPRLGTFSDESIGQHVAALRSLVAAVEELDLDALEDEIDRTALLNDMRVADHRFTREQPHRRNPGFWVGHVLEGLYQPLVLRGRDGAAVARAAGARLEQVPAVLAEAERTLCDCPRVFVETARDMCRAAPALVDDVRQACGGGSAEHAGVAAEAAQAALRHFDAHLVGMLHGAPIEGWAVGREAVNFRLHYQHALGVNDGDLLRYGLQLAEQTERELAEQARLLGGGSWPDVMARLRADLPWSGALLDAYRAAMEDARVFVEHRGLVTVPEGPLAVEETPGFLHPLVPRAAYLPPGALSADRTGRLFVTVPPAGVGVGDDLCRHEILVTAVHEGYPGHHVHFLSAQAQPRYVRRVVMVPAGVEGWALYGEELMEEQGFFASPEARFFRRVALLWRALRIPLDIGLHTGVLDYEAGIRLVTDRMHYPRACAEAEVRRACAEPAYQLAYGAGRRELLALRDAYRQRAGAGYSVRAFHDAVLAYGGLAPSLVRWGLGVDG